MSDHTAADPSAAPPHGPERRGVPVSAGSRATHLELVVVGIAAVGLIALLVVSNVALQFGPGGALSEVRPGRPAPDFDVPLLDGGRVRLSDLRGRPVVLNFWASWCPPCVVELPLLFEAEERHADLGLVVVALNAGQHHDYVAAFLKEQGLDIPAAIDPGKDVYEAYRVVGLPTTIWIDGEGIVRGVEVGALTADKIDAQVTGLVKNGR